MIKNALKFQWPDFIPSVIFLLAMSWLLHGYCKQPNEQLQGFMMLIYLFVFSVTLISWVITVLIPKMTATSKKLSLMLLVQFLFFWPYSFLLGRC